MSDVRYFRKTMIGNETRFRRDHMGAIIRARRDNKKGSKWMDARVLYVGTLYKAPGAYKRIAEVEAWAIGLIRKLRKNEPNLFVLWDDSEHLFLVEAPYWSAGVWTQDINKAHKFSKSSAEALSLETSRDWKIMTVKEARAMLKKSTYVTRRII